MVALSDIPEESNKLSECYTPHREMLLAVDREHIAGVSHGHRRRLQEARDESVESIQEEDVTNYTHLSLDEAYRIPTARHQHPHTPYLSEGISRTPWPASAGSETGSWTCTNRGAVVVGC